MAGASTCKECGEEFKHVHARKQHQKKEHQGVVKLKLKGKLGGSEVRGVGVERGEEGVFKCVHVGCEFSTKTPRNLQRHVGRCRVGGEERWSDEVKSRLVPLGEDIEWLSGLEKYGLVWNTWCHIMICTKCHVGVRPEHAYAHCQSHRLVEGTTAKAFEELMKVVPTEHTFPEVPHEYKQGELCKAVQGLMIFSGYVCSVCDYGCVKWKVMGNHFYKEHRERAEERKELVDLRWVQILYSQGRRRYFGVEGGGVDRNVGAGVRSGGMEQDSAQGGRGNEGGREELSVLFAEKLERHERAKVAKEKEGGGELVAARIANWLQVTGLWHYIEGLKKEGISTEEMMDAVAIDEEVPKLAEKVGDWIEGSMKRLHMMGPFLKRALLSETVDMENNKGIMPLQERSTVDEYGMVIGRFMCYLIRQMKKPIERKLLLKYSTRQEIEGLIVVIKREREREEASRESMEVDELAGTEDEAEVVGEGSGRSIGYMVQRILCSLFQKKVWARDCSWWIPVMNFLGLCMVKEDGGFRGADKYSHWLACLQYGVRMAFSEEFQEKNRLVGDGERDFAADDEETRSEDYGSFVYLRKGEPCPFNVMRQEMHLIGTVIRTEQLPERTCWVDSEMGTLEIDDETVTISGIRDCIHHVDKLMEQKYLQVVEGCKMPEFEVNQYKDQPNNTKEGFNYLVHSKVAHNKYRHHIIKQWQLGGDPKGVFQVHVEGLLRDEKVLVGSEEMWNTVKVWAWLDEADTLLEMLYFLYHVASGQPSRGTEETSIQLVNSVGSVRNIFWRGQHFVIVTWYHKGRNQHGQNKPRMVFLPGRHSQIWHFYLGFVRPAEIFLLEMLGEGERAREKETLVWVSNRQGVLDTPKLSNILKRWFRSTGVAALGISKWRQVSVAICDAWIKDYESAYDPTYSHTVDRQRGHTSRTANLVYGGTSGSGIDRQMEWQYRQASKELHRFWNIDSVLEVHFEPNVVLPELSGVDKSIKSLRLFTKNGEARFNSTFQADWVVAVMEAQEDLLVVARTGGGKSLGYMLPPHVEPVGCTIVIQPLLALVRETAEQLGKQCISHVVYRPNVELGGGYRVIVVTTDQAGTIGFKQAVQFLRINRVIVDEAHCYKDDAGYRTYANGVARLRQLNTAFVFMTASLPLADEEYLRRLFGLKDLRVMREETARRELHFYVPPVVEEMDAIRRRFLGMYRMRVQQGVDRGIVFIEDKEKCGEFMEWLKKEKIECMMYHSGVGDEEGKEAIRMWKEREKSVMVATSGFGAGINYAHVRVVMIVGLPRLEEVNKAYQEAGRAGRDGELATVMMMATEGAKDMLQGHLLNREKCVHETFSEIEDGVSIDCESLKAMLSCSHCSQRQKRGAESQRGGEGAGGGGGSGGMMGVVRGEGFGLNVKRKRMEVQMNGVMALAISRVRETFVGVCGWCFAKTRQKVIHKLGQCPHHGRRCFRCHSGAHGSKSCKVMSFSVCLKKHGTKKDFMCRYCGLGRGYEKVIFHPEMEAGQVGEVYDCKSGLRDVCELGCWYFYEHERVRVSGIVREVMEGMKKEGKEISEVNLRVGYMDYLARVGEGEWANAVSLFFRLTHGEMLGGVKGS